jgi:hypothetical protein
MIFKPTNDQFTIRVASTFQEACELIESSFDYVTGNYNDGGKIFRKKEVKVMEKTSAYKRGNRVSKSLFTPTSFNSYGKETRKREN